MKIKKRKLTSKKILIFSFFAATLFLSFFSATQAQAQSITLQDPLTGCLGSTAFVNLNWIHNISGNPVFSVLRKIQGTGDFIEIDTTTSTYYNNSSVDSDKNYVYKIESGTISSEEKTALASYCSPVLSPANTSCPSGNPTISLNWSACSGNLLIYEIYRDNIKIHETAINNFSDDLNLEGTKEYNYFVKAIWQNGASTSSNEISVIAPVCPPNLNVPEISCLTVDPGGPRIDLSWNSLLGVQKYQIYRKALGESDFSEIGQTTFTSFSDNLVETLENYGQEGPISYRIRAIWETDYKYSNAQQIITPRCQPFLEVVSNCGESEFSFRLYWTATRNANLYNIYRNGTFYAQVPSLYYIDYLDENVCPGKICDMTYHVEASISPVEVSNSVTKPIDCATIAPPSPPPFLHSLKNYCSSDGSSRIKFSWIPSENVTSYGVYRNLEPVGGTMIENDFIDTGLQGEEGYTYFVTAFGQSGTATNSVNSLTTTTINCSPISGELNLTLTRGCENGLPFIQLNWDETGNTLKYDIFRGTTESNLELITTLDKNFLTFKDNNEGEGLNPSSSYYYRVDAKGHQGVLPKSSDVESMTTFSCLPYTPWLYLYNNCQDSFPWIRVYWYTTHSNTQRYEIFREDYENGETPIHIVYPNTTSWGDYSISPETNYKYKVEAVGPSGRSTQGYKNITSYDCSLPGPFTLSDPTISCIGPYPNVFLSWTESSNANYYNLYRLLNHQTTFSNLTVTSFTDFGFGNALSFDGNDYITIPDSESLDINERPISIFTWISPSSITTESQWIIAKNYDAVSNIQYGILLEPTWRRIRVYLEGELKASSATFSLNMQRWNHVGFTWAEDGNIRVYINGVQSGSTSNFTGSLTSRTRLRIGRRMTASDLHFRGLMNDFRIYGKTLTGSEVSNLYNRQEISSVNLRGHWHFNEGEGQFISDGSNHGNTGILGLTSSPDAYDPSWIVNGLQTSVNYQWRVRAYSYGGNIDSNLTATTTFFCPPAKPGLVLIPSCGSGGEAIMNISFSFSINTTEYQIYKDGNLLATTSQGINPSSRFFVDNEVSTSTSYTYWVKAVGSGGETESDHLDVTTFSCIAPPSVTDLTASFVCGGTGNSYPAVNLNWSTSTGVDYYTIYRTPEDSPFPVTTFFNSYTDSSVKVDSGYSYYVIAYAPGGVPSEPSNTVNVNVGYCDLSTPLITSLITYCEGSAPVNKISWFDSTPFNTSEYKIYRNTTGNFPNEGDLIANYSNLGYYLGFNGSGYINLLPHEMTKGQSEITLEFWINPDPGFWTSTRTVWDECYYSVYQYWQFSIRADFWRTRDTSTGPTGIRNNDLAMPDLTPGEWHHLAFVYSVTENRKTIYLNGVFSTSTSDSIYPLTSERTFTQIGGACDGFNFRGKLDRVRIYRRALDEVEIQQHYNGTFNNETDLWGNWKFNEGSGLIAYDNSVNGHHGNISSSGVTWFSQEKTYIDNDIDLQINQDYYYWVKSLRPPSESDFSTSVSIKTYNCGSVPEKPTLELIDSYCENNLPYATLKWNSVSNAYSYNLYRENLTNNTTSTYSTRLPETELTDGKNNYSLRFIPPWWGTGPYLNCGYNEKLNTPFEATIENWFNPSSITLATHVGLARYPDLDQGWYIHNYRNSDWASGRFGNYIVYTNTENKSRGFALSSLGFSTGNWYHTATVLRSDGWAGFYINGELKSWYLIPDFFKWGGNNAAANTFTRIGGYHNARGFIDEVRIYNRSLTEEEINYHYQGIYENETGLIAVWHFDEGQEAIAYDQSGNANNCTLQPSSYPPTWQTDSPGNIKVLPLENLKEYAYKVKAFGSDTESPFSNTISFNPDCLPAVPVLDIINDCNYTESPPKSFLKLTWQEDVNTNYWQIWGRRKEFGYELKRIPDEFTIFTDPIYIDNNVQTGKTYEYFVEAFGFDPINYATSSVVEKEVGFCVAVPYGGNPFPLTATPACYGYSSRIKIEWPLDDVPSRTFSYNVFSKKDTGEFEPVSGGQGLPPTTNYFLHIVNTSTVYEYLVEAVGSMPDNSLFSVTSTATTSLDCANLPPFPPMPSVIGVTSTWKKDPLELNTYVFLQWQDVGNAEWYEVLRCLGQYCSNFTSIATTTGLLDPTIIKYWTDSSNELEDGKIYEYKIKAFNIINFVVNETESYTFSADVPIAPPSPFKLEANDLGSEVSLTWTAASSTLAGGPVEYDVWRDSTANFSSTFLGTTTTLSWIDNSPLPTERYYRITARNSSAYSSYSNVVFLGTSLPKYREVIPTF